jgi:hypothetical protein
MGLRAASGDESAWVVKATSESIHYTTSGKQQQEMTRRLDAPERAPVEPGSGPMPDGVRGPPPVVPADGAVRGSRR